MTAATEEAHRLLRIAKADYVACKALLAADGVRFAIATTLVAMVETVLTWAQARVEHADHGA